MSLTPLEISNLMSRESPVFIVGAPRSGTQILYGTLQRHSSFKLQKCSNSSGLDFTESWVFQNPNNTYLRPYTSAFRYLLKDKDVHCQFLQSVKWIKKYQNLIIGKHKLQKIAKRSNLGKSLYWKFTLNQHLLRIFFYYAKQARGENRILEKTPESIFNLIEIKATFPKAKLLFINRHPIDVFTSYKRRLKLRKNYINSCKNQKKSISKIILREMNWLTSRELPQDFSNFYQKSIQIALKEAADNPRGFMLVRYEDFVNKPKITLQNICDFLEEPYEQECLLANKEEQFDPLHSGVDPYRNSSIKKVTKDWRDFINEDEAKSLENQLSEIICQLDYPRYT